MVMIAFTYLRGSKISFYSRKCYAFMGTKDTIRAKFSLHKIC